VSDVRLGPADVAALFDRRRLRLARELRGLTQVELARDVGSVTAASLSQFENGHSRPSAATLIRISVALQVPLAFFAAPARIPSRSPVGGFFRSLRSTAPRDRQQALAYVQLARELTLELERFVALPDLDVPRFPIGSGSQPVPDEIEETAARVRRHWNVPSGPIDNAIRVLEANGIIVIRFRLGIEKVDAFCVDFDDRPVVVLGADKDVRDRSRFDAAHELGHLVMHSDADAGDKTAERQANQFAAAFLMPADDIKPELPTRVDWSQLLALKEKWHVSIAALLVRAKTLNVIDERTYTQAWKSLTARGWRKQEPWPLGAPEVPTLIHRALELASQTGLTFDDLLARSGLPERDVRVLLDQSRDDRPRVQI
jgi:Zn-dependent peptidase ImmA (M78 family)/transcriptional regulator with XRE-family HTH domain